MRDRHCLQCGIFIPVRKGWRFQTTKRMGGLIHDTCLNNYIKHKQVITTLRKKLRQRARRIKCRKHDQEYQHQYYIRHINLQKRRNHEYYWNNVERLRKYQRSKYKVKHYWKETDNEFIVKTWPRWKTLGGWII